MIQIKYNSKSVIDYLKEEDFMTLFSLNENDTCDTFKLEDENLIKLLFQRRTVNDEKYIKTFTILYQWRLNNAKEGSFNSDILITDSKTTE